MKVIILCLLFLIPTAIAADKGIFYILDEKFIDNINELPFSAGTPDKIMQSSNNINVWIDITGFNAMSREDGVDYIFDLPESVALVQYEAYGSPPGSIDRITPTLSVSQSGDLTIAVLSVVMAWHEYRSCGKDECRYDHTNSASFQDSEISPRQYKPISGELKINITQYNNSLYENIGFSIVNISGLNKYTIQYEDNIATYRLKKAHVEQTAKGVYFANVTPAEFLDLKGKNISRYGKMILLNGNLSKMSPGDIKITGLNLYETKTADSSQFNITRLEFKPEKELENSVMMWFMSVMAVMVGGIYFYARRMSVLW
jgi:hypothetical protein